MPQARWASDENDSIGCLVSQAFKLVLELHHCLFWVSTLSAPSTDLGTCQPPYTREKFLTIFLSLSLILCLSVCLSLRFCHCFSPSFFSPSIYRYRCAYMYIGSVLRRTLTNTNRDSNK